MDRRERFDLVVLGGGPGGYPAAIKAAQLGKKVALVEAKELGGTCLNRGCIPSKTLIADAEVLRHVQGASEYGISVGEVSFDYGKMVDRKDAVVAQMRRGLEGLIRSNRITLFRGFGKLTSPKTLQVVGDDAALLEADKIILATGSEPRNIPAFPCDGVKVLDSTALLDLRRLPKKVAIIGGGIIGCEFASLYQAFGVDVEVIEMMSRLLPTESSGVSAALTKAYERKGIRITTDAMVTGIDDIAEGVAVKLAGDRRLEADIALVAVGRSLNVRDIGLEQVGVLVHDNGLVAVDKHMQTTVEGIYAVGDIASKWWLAHVASHQGLVAARHACGEKGAMMHYNAVPSVIFTVPEIATVGLSLEQATEQGYHPTLGAFPFQALGKSQAILETEGFAQVVIDKGTGQILGAQVVGYGASSLIAEMAVAIANELTVAALTETIHAHPSLPEAWLEATLLANETPLHLPPKVKK